MSAAAPALDPTAARLRFLARQAEPVRCVDCGRRAPHGRLRCEQCRARRAAQREYYARNRERVAAAQREYYARNRERVAAAQREYRARNRERVAAAQREYYARNRERVAAAKREYRARNRERVAAAQREYYARNRERVAAAKRDRWQAAPPACVQCGQALAYGGRGRPPRRCADHGGAGRVLASGRATGSLALGRREVA